MLQHQTVIELETRGRGFSELTRELAAFVERSGVRAGLCVVFCQHTSASLLITENADPTARADVLRRLGRIAPDGDPADEHDDEGPDDSSAHQKSAITRTSETIPIVDGRLALGTWQGVFLVEHRVRAHRRRVVVHVQGVT
ncbi:MAG: YjbQ family protein [Planctomycetes bacterium]|nr:YjbQ family protein [Planctomycetota bacterium]